MSLVVKPNRSNFITVPELLRFQLENNPTHPAFVFAPESELGETEDSLTKITFLEYVRAAHRAAHLVRPLNRSGSGAIPDRAVVGLVALLDNHVYQTVVAGIMQAGLVPLLISPRLPPAAVINLLKLSGSHRLLITGTTLRDLLHGIKEQLSSEAQDGRPYEVTFAEAPSLNELYPKLGNEKGEDVFGQEYPWLREHSTPHQTAVYLHSSGSTGLPKAIPVTHGAMLYSFHSVLSAYSTYKNYEVPLQIGAVALPPFHVMAFFTQLIAPLYASITIGLFPPKVTTPDSLPMLATPEDAIKHVQLTRSNSAVFVPTFLQIYSKDKRYVDILSGMENVVYSGGPLAPATGDYLVACGVRLKQVYGLTEVGLPIMMTLEEGYEDWAWVRFEERVEEQYIRWAPLGDGTFELHILTTDRWRPAVENLPDIPGYATSDIFLPHPTKPGLWQIAGRTDDVIIHASGEKTTALPIEHVVIQSPLIQGAVVFGRQRDQAGILIEPKPENQIDVKDDAAVSRFRNQIWPAIEQANEISPAYSKIYKEMILITSADKPLPRAAKGTVMRKATYALYEKEINQIYEAVESNASSGSVAPPSTWEVQDIRNWVMTQVVELCGNRLELSDDLFEHGVDSLSATVLRLRITGALRASEDESIRKASRQIDQTTVYKHPTVDGLANFIVGLINNSGEDTDPTIAISRMISKYSRGLDTPIQTVSNGTHSSNTHQHAVLLTGSTGNLGAQMLASLLMNDSVARVYTLNRSSARMSLLDRHRERFEDKALDVGLLSSKKLVFLEGEASQSRLGLTDELYNELLQNVTIIIHNAWRLDFNLALSSFEPHIRGTRNLIDFARASNHATSVRLLFTSSIAATQSWNTATQGAYPDHIDPDPWFAVGGGYGESKYVTERILQNSGLNVSILRIGQISGGKPNGAWATSDWFPMVVKSSLNLNMLPDAHGLVSWAPMDAISDAIIDVAFTPGELPVVVNLVHPTPVSWTSMIDTVRTALISVKHLDSNALPLVTFSKWVAALEDAGKSKNTTTDQALAESPALKILSFLQHMAQGDELVAKASRDPNAVEAAGLSTLDTTNAVRISPRMRELEPIGPADSELWIDYWMKKGFL
ncbi:acetyl-CoA synthetase-like protein [Lentinula raphanica]|nr:acetyl-CoA synthetase-like protein [Lentinula raphanica]